MRRRSILWHLYPYHLLVIVAALLATGIYVSRSMRDFHLRRTGESLAADARLVEHMLRDFEITAREAGIDSLCKDLGRTAGTRATVVLASGRVIGDSDEAPGRMENHADRPEFAGALSGGTGRATRFSDTLRRREMYVAVPIRRGDAVVGAVRISMPLTAIDDKLRGFQLRIALGGIVAAVLAGIASYAVARRISRPLDEIKRGVERFAGNDLSYRLPVFRLDEAGELAERLNELAERLDERIRAEVGQRNEQEAVLASMVEGLVAVDMEERIMRLNRAAASFLEASPEGAVGRSIQEVVRNPELQQFVQRALSSDDPIEGDIALRGALGDRFLQAHGAELRGAEGRRIGAVIVLNDVTRLQRLEEVRRDFVANVSHELKTPITSIKGFIETLRDGSAHDAVDAKKFLDIIAKQADRLNSIIEDLLFLSRLEQNGTRGGVSLERVPLRAVLLEAMEICGRAAKEKGVVLEIDCPESIEATINPVLVEQALVNLIDNAVTYSDAGRSVAIAARREPGGLRIDVVDHGCGIEREHLARIFERFYRVDKARSRTRGGTGLGLSIVKHIVHAHGGSVSVESVPGSGSTFTINLPQSE
jgi:two-component system phosphate regulon sensor histidine kinase PhoR